MRSGFEGFADASFAFKACLLLIATQLSAEELEEYRQMFNRLDSNGDGFVSLDEITEHITDDDEEEAQKSRGAAPG